jgi:hypothetical protein
LATGVLVTLLSACSSIHVFRKDDSAERARQLEEVQIRVMRFADEYVGRIVGPLNTLQARTADVHERLDAQNWKVSQATAAYINASESNPVTGTVDMIVLAVLSRMVVEDDQRGGPARLRSASLRETHEKLEREAWELGGSIMDEQQREQLRNAIHAWRAANPDVRAVALVHFADVSQILASDQKGFMSRGLLGFISIDSTWGLDPAVREIAQTRQVVQRSIYYAQRAPQLLDMQVERLTYQLAAMPETRSLLLNVDRTADAAQRAGRLADVLPAVVAQEREAAIDQMMGQLGLQQAKLRALVQDLHGMLDAGTVTSSSLNTTIQSLDSLVARFKPGTPPVNAAADPRAPAVAKPPLISQYADALRELANTTEELQKLVVTLDDRSGGVERLVHSASADAKELARYLLVLILLLTLGLAAIIVAAVLATRRIGAALRG